MSDLVRLIQAQASETEADKAMREILSQYDESPTSVAPPPKEDKTSPVDPALFAEVSAVLGQDYTDSTEEDEESIAAQNLPTADAIPAVEEPEEIEEEEEDRPWWAPPVAEDTDKHKPSVPKPAQEVKSEPVQITPEKKVITDMVKQDTDSKFDIKEILSPVKEVWDKIPRIVKIMFAAVGIILVILLVVAQCTKSAPTSPVTPQVPQEVPQITSSAPKAEGEKSIMPTDVSTNCQPPRTDPSSAFTGNLKDAWVCGRPGGRDNSILTMTLDDTYIITSISFVPGWNYAEDNGRDHWVEHRLPSFVLWKIGGQTREMPIKPLRTGVTIDFTDAAKGVKGIATRTLSLNVQDTVKPVDVEDPKKKKTPTTAGPIADTNVDASFALSNIVINGYKAGT